MNKVYNTQENFATEIKNFLLNAIPNIRKTQLKIIPYIVLGMILSESVVASDISILFNILLLLKELDVFSKIDFLIHIFSMTKSYTLL